MQQQQQQHPYQYGGQAAPPVPSLVQPLSAYPPSSMERNLGWPGETASLGPMASTMELLHGPQLMSMSMSMNMGDESGDYGDGDAAGGAGTMLQHEHELDEREGHSGKAPRQKRNRSALSCAECRRLKLKCSREPWPCSVRRSSSFFPSAFLRPLIMQAELTTADTDRPLSSLYLHYLPPPCPAFSTLVSANAAHTELREEVGLSAPLPVTVPLHS